MKIVLLIGSALILASCQKVPDQQQQQNGATFDNTPDVSVGKPVKIADYVRHQCDKYGRAIYRSATNGGAPVSIFVIDRAPECGSQPQANQQTNSL